MTSRILVFDHFTSQSPIAELNNIPTTPRSWLLNQYGKCEFSMSTADPKCTLRNLQFGNLVHIQHIPQKDENGNLKGTLPDWTGIILPNQNWDYGVVHVVAYSIECFLAFRAMPYVTVKGTPAEVFTRILELAHKRWKNITIQPGTMDDISQTFSDNLTTNAYDHILKLCKDSGMDFDITGELDSQGRLQLFSNLYTSKGIETSLVLNSKNTETQSPLLSLQGTPSNVVYGHSHANTDVSRFVAEALDQESIDEIGPLELNQVFVGRRDLASTQNAADARVIARSRPVARIVRTVLDYTNAFNFLSVGNTVTVKETEVGFNPDGGFGFEKQFRILSMSYNDMSNKVPMTIEEI